MSTKFQSEENPSHPATAEEHYENDNTSYNFSTDAKKAESSIFSDTADNTALSQISQVNEVNDASIYNLADISNDEVDASAGLITNVPPAPAPTSQTQEQEDVTSPQIIVPSRARGCAAVDEEIDSPAVLRAAYTSTFNNPNAFNFIDGSFNTGSQQQPTYHFNDNIRNSVNDGDLDAGFANANNNFPSG